MGSFKFFLIGLDWFIRVNFETFCTVILNLLTRYKFSITGCFILSFFLSTFFVECVFKWDSTIEFPFVIRFTSLAAERFHDEGFRGTD